MHGGDLTRFICYSYDPSRAIFTISYNHPGIGDYELAFSATEAFPNIGLTVSHICHSAPIPRHPRSALYVLQPG